MASKHAVLAEQQRRLERYRPLAIVAAEKDAQRLSPRALGVDATSAESVRARCSRYDGSALIPDPGSALQAFLEHRATGRRHR